MLLQLLRDVQVTAATEGTADPELNGAKRRFLQGTRFLLMNGIWDIRDHSQQLTVTAQRSAIITSATRIPATLAPATLTYAL